MKERRDGRKRGGRGRGRKRASTATLAGGSRRQTGPTPTPASVLGSLLREEALPEISLVSQPASGSPCASGKSWWSLDLVDTCMYHVGSA